MNSSGDITMWLCWSRTCKRFLKKHAVRWIELLGRIEELIGVRVTSANEWTWNRELWMRDIETRKNQFS